MCLSEHLEDMVVNSGVPSVNTAFNQFLLYGAQVIGIVHFYTVVVLFWFPKKNSKFRQ